MATAGNIIGKVAVLQGQAFARAKDGTQRALKVGDAVFENEVIVTAENSRVELEFDSGKVFLLRAKETVTLDSAVIGSELPENRNAALLDRVGELADITRAIAEGSSLDQLLEETAAGLTGGGRDDGGHGFVQLLRIAEALDPAGFNYRFNPNDLSFELPPGGGVPDGVPIPAPAPLPPAPGGNLTPTAAAVSVLGAEDAASIPVSLSAADADGTIASYTIVSLPANGMLYADAAHTIVVSAGDTVVGPALFFVPNPNWNGTTSFNFTATDDSGAISSPAIATLSVTPVDDASVMANDTNTVTEDTPLVAAAAGVLANDSDVDNALAVTSFQVAGDATVYAAGATAAIAGVGSLTLNADGSYIFAPAANYSGAVPVATYTVNTGSTATLTITVNAVNDAPVAVDDVNSTNEDTPVSSTLNLHSNDTDIDSASLSVAAASVGTFATTAGGSITVAADGSYTYTPPANFSGSDTFDYTVTDGALTDIGRLTITVNAVNDAPVAVDDVNSTNEDTPVSSTLNLHSNDTDIDSASLSVAAASVGTFATTAGGSITVAADGSYTYTPPANFSGSDTFDYTVTDGALTDIGRLTITVNAVNDAPVAVDDVNSTNEDTPVSSTLNLHSNDTDIDSASLSVAAASVGTFATTAGGSITVAADGSYTYTPPANFSGSDTFDYTVTDGALTDIGRLTITVNAVNDAPVAVDDVNSTNEDTPVSSTLNLHSNDTDIDSASLSVAAASVGTFATTAGGSITVAADGSYTYTPPANFSGSDTFDYTVTDGALTDIGRLTITVNAVNDAPVAVDDVNSTNEDTPVSSTLNLHSNDTDIDSASLSVAAASVGTFATTAGGSITVAADGSYTYTPPANFSGSDTFDYTVTDGALTDIGRLTITVNAVNDAPVAVDDVNSTNEDTPVSSTLNLHSNDTDIDSASLSVAAASVGTFATTAGGSITVAADGSYTYTPPANFSGSDTFDYTVTDGALTDIGRLTITVNAVNDAPVAVDDVNSTNEDTPVSSTLNLHSNDTDIDSASLSVAAASVGTFATTAGGSITVAADGSYTYTPPANFSGSDTFDYTVTDGALTDIGRLTITVNAVNDAPVAVDDVNSTNEDTPVSSTLNLHSNDTDIDSASLSVAAASVGTFATTAGGSITVAADGSYTYTPPANFSGSDTFDYTVTDGALTDIGRLTITVNAVNDAPVAVDDVNSTNEDTPVSSTLNLHSNDTDIDSASLSVAAASVGTFATTAGGSITVAADGSYTYTPPANFSGSDTFDYTVTDGALTDIGRLTITVNAVNDAPVAVDDVNSTNEDTPVSSTLNLHSNDTDIDSASLSVAAASVGTFATTAGGSITVAADGSYTYTPPANFSGSDTFDYTVTDGALTDIGRLTITVNAVNDAPVAVDDVNSTNEDTPVSSTLNLHSNDTDIDSASLSVAAASVGTFATTAGGSITVAADGSYTYTPPANFSGSDTFDYTVTDGALTDIGRLTITVNAVNDAPVAVDDVNSTNEDTPVSSTLNLHSNDTDIDSASLSVAAASVGTFATTAGGSITVAADGSYTYTPPANFSGSDTFDYTVTDGALTDIGRLTITVNAVNDAPVAVDDVNSTNEDTPVSSTLNLHSNDTDIDSASLSVAAASVGTFATTAGGSITVAADGSYTYTPPANFSGSDTFDYTVTDGALTDIGRLTITVNAVNDAPVAVDDVNSTNEDTPVSSTLNLHSNDTDIDSASLSVAAASVGTFATTAGGSITVAADGSYTYTPPANFSGSDTFDYTVTDGALTDIGRLTITVNAVNDAPVAVDDVNSTNEDTPVSSTLNLHSNDTDIDSASLSVAAASVGTFATTAGGSITVAADGSYTYTPPANFSGSDTFDYTVTDGALTDIGRLTITVNAVNDAPVAVDDVNSTNEDTPVSSTLNLHSNDTDIDSASLSVAAASVGTFATTAGGSITVAADGSYTYTPPANFSGSDTFDYTVTDGALTDIGRLTITVNAVNDAPVAVDDVNSTNEDTPVSSTLNLHSNDTDIDSASLSVAAASVGTFATTAGGSITVAADGSYTYTPPANFSGSDTFDYTVTDGALTDIGRLTITVNAVNDAPVAVDDVNSTNEDTPVSSTLNLHSNDTDIDSASLSVAAASVGTFATTAGGSITVAADGSYTYTPPANFSGSDTFDYTVTDGALTDIGRLTITVNAVNDAPVAVDDVNSTNEDTPVSSTLNLHSNDTDIDSASLSVAAASVGTFATTAGGSITVAADGSYTYTPPANFSGSDTFDYTVTDGALTDIGRLTITVNAVNDAPVAVDDVNSTNEDTPVSSTLNLHSNDTDIDSASLSVAAASVGTFATTAGGSITVAADGSYTYTPPANFSGSDTFDYTVTDGALTDIGRLTITVNAVNDAPVAVDDVNSTNEDTPVSSTLNLHSNDTDIDSASLSVAAASVGTFATTAGGSITVAADGSYTYTPPANFSGSDTFDYTVTDGALTDIGRLTITVNAVNDAPVAVDDVNSTNEDTPVSSTLNLHSNDTDIDSASLSVAAASVGTFATTAGGSITVAADGSYTYTPPANFSGSDTFDYTVTDGALTDIGRLTITVNAVNDAPVAVDDVNSTNEDTPVSSTLNLHSNDTDIDSASLSVAAASVGTFATTAGGSITVAADGSYTYTPPANFSGSDTFDYTVTDGALTDIGRLTITVNAVNDAPVAVDDVNSTNEDTPVSSTLNLHSNDTDIDSASLSVAAASVGTFATTAGGSITVAADGSYTYTPPANFSGSDTFDYTVTDGALTDIGRLTITVNAVNDAPVAVDDVNSTNEDTPVSSTLNLHSNDTDIDSASLSVAAASVGTFATTAGGSITVAADGSYTYTPPANFSGSDTFDYTVTDGALTDIGRLTITVNAVNDAPVAVDDVNSTNEDTPVSSTLNLHSNDTDIDSASLSVAAASVGTFATTAGGSITVAADGSYTYTPPANFSGSDTFDYTVTDGALTDIGRLTITVNAVNDAPVAVDDVNSTNEDTPVSSTLNLHSNDTDIDSASLSVAAASVGTFATTAGGSITVAADGSYTYTPPANFSGSDTFDYTVTDGALTDIGRLTITVNAVNDAPVAVYDVNSTNEDTPVSSTLNLHSNDTDIDSASLSVAAASVGTFATTAGGSITVAADGSYTYTPPANFSGSDTFDYTVTDGALTDIGRLTITVNAVNDAPVAVDDVNSTNEDTPVSSTLNLHSNDTDIDSASLSVAAASVGTFATTAGGSITVAADGSYTYTPPANFSGSDTFDYTVTDGALTDIGRLTITVNAVNDAPVAVDDVNSTNEDTPVSSTLNLHSNDTDIDSASLSVAAASVGTFATTAGGSITVAADGSYTYTPPANFSGSDTFDYTVTDGALTDIGRLTITVNAVNDAPVAVDDVNSTNEDTPVSSTLNLHSNDTDIDSASLSVAAASVGTFATTAGGSITVAADGSYTYTPPANFSGSDTFDYTVTDGALTDIGRLTITVNAVNDAPVAVDDVNSTNEDTPVSSTLNLHSNDTDIDSASLSVAAASVGTFATTAGGSITVAADGSYTYTPPANFSGSDTFDYTVTDGALTDIGRLTITVNAVNDAPVAVDDVNSTNEDTPVSSTLNLHSNDTDIDSASLSVAAASVGTFATTAGGSITVAADGSYTYTPPANFSGSDTFDYTVTDGALTDIGRLTITVNAVNDAPVAVDDVNSTNEDTPVSSTLNLHSNDTDIDSASLSVAAASVGTFATTAGGSITVAADGSYTYTPPANFSGSDTFDYTVTDGALTDIGRLTITVNAVNDAPVAVDDVNSTNEDTPVSSTLNLHSNDTDIDSASLSVAAASVGTFATTAGGSITVAADGSYTYTPPANFSGSDTFDYTVTDGALTDIGRLTITVNAVNDAPVAVDDVNSTNEDTPVSSTLNLHSNDTDIDSASLSVAAASVGTFATTAGGSITVAADGSYTYTPPANFSGSDTFDYTVTDGALTDIGRLTITVNAVNDAPVAVDDVNSTNEDTPVSSTLNLHSNDTDIDSASLSVAAASVGTFATTAGGSITVAADGSYTYTPPANFSGSDTFDYTVTDGALTDIGRLTITVNAVNDAPVNTVPGAQAGTEDTNLVFSVANGNAITVADADGGTLTTTVSIGNGTLTAVTGGGAAITNNGTATMTIQGTAAQINAALNGLTFAPTADYNGAATLSVSTGDGSLTDTDTVAITVTPAADIAADTISTNEDTAITFDPIAGTNGASADNFENAGRTITAINGTAIAVGGSVAVTGGTVTLNAGGTLTYMPTANYNGTPSFTYTVTSGGVTETATVNVTVNAANDVPALDLDASASGTGYVTVFNTDTGSPVSIADIDVSVIDPDMVITGATITLTNAQAGDFFVAGTMPVGITASIVGNVVTLSGSSTPANYQAAISAINFDTTNTASNANRSITVSVTDGVATSNVATTTVSILGVGNAPVLDLDANNSSSATGTGYQSRFTVGASAVAIGDVDVSISDSDSANLTGATITLSNFQANDILAAGTLPGGITASAYNPATGVITLSGTSSLANYQAAIRAITFSNSSGSPSLADRTINVVVTDGTNSSNTAVATIGINRAPTIDLDANDSTTTGSNYLTTYTDGAGAVALSDVDINVTDADGVLMGASITLTNPKAGDVLAVGTMPAGITATVAGNTVSLSGAATPADYQAAIHAITFSNASGTPDTTPRTIAVSVTDGAVTSNTATATISVVEVNSAPVLDLDASVAGSDYATFYSTVTRPDVPVSDTDVSVTDADSINITGATITLTNAQAGDVLIVGSMPPGITASVVGNVVTLSGSTFITDYQAAIRAISFNTTSSDLTARTITVTVTDGTSTSNIAATTITMVPANNPPVADTIAASGNEDALIPVILSGTDSDGTVTAFSLSTLPASGQLYLDAAMTQTVPTGTQLSASGSSLTLYFKPPQDWNGNASFNYTATDDLGGVSPVATATVTVNPVNDGTPVALADSYSTVVGTPIIITKASLLANDTQFDHAAITAVTAPSSGTLVLSGDGTYYTYTPTGVPGAPTFTYTITDDDGQTSTATVSIGVYGAGDDLSTIQESALVGGAGTSTVSGNLFSNDMGNTSLTSVTLASANTGLPGEVNIVSNTTVGNIITVVSQIGTLVVDKTTGAYTYTLNHSADNTASNMSVEETFNYVGNNSSAALRVTVQDDMPVAANVTVEIPENTLPKYTLVLTLDCSGSMSDQVQSVAADGTVTLTTRMAMQNAAVSALISEYFSQATDVSVKIVAFGTSAAIMNNGNAFTDKDAAIAAINTLVAGSSVIDGVAIGNMTNYADALVKTQTALGGTIDATRSNIVYFLSDGNPTQGDTVAPVTSSGYATYLTLHPEINSFGVGVGSGITNVSHLNQIHNVDALGDGTRDPAIIVADVNKLEESLISTVPAAYGGNVISANSAQSVTFGADGGYVNQVSLMLDTDGNPATAEQLVTFNYNNATDQITWSGGFPPGSPLAGNLLTLNDSKGFDHGTLVFNFQSGDYTYFTAGLAHEGDSFSLSFVAVDKDGDTAAATQTISIVDGKPVANDDSDTLAALNQYLEGNVVTGIGTDGGIALGSQLTNFTPQASGVDNAADNAQVTSIVFKGVTYNLTVDSSGSNSGGSYTVSGGTLSWTHASNGSQLEFSENGYYKYTPPTADVPVENPAAVSTIAMTSAANVSAGGLTLEGLTNLNAPAYSTTITTSFTSAPANITLQGIGSNGTTTYAEGALTYSGSGVALNSTGDASGTRFDTNETLVVNFDAASYPQGVANPSFSINVSNAGNMVYQVFDTSGALIGGPTTVAAGNLSLTGYDNVGSVRIQATTSRIRVTNATYADPATATTVGYNANGASVGTAAAGGISNLETLVINFDAATHPLGVQKLRFEVTNGGANDAVTYTFYHVDGHELGQYTVAGNGWITMPVEFSGVGRVTALADTGTSVNIRTVEFKDVINVPAAPAVAPEIIQYTLTDSDGDTSSAKLTLNITTNTLAGDDTANTLTGTAANDAIHGLGGDDTITGGAGHDIIQGGDGNDIIDGGADDDTITGGAGNDALTGGTGSDTLRGQEGDDSLDGGAGSDRLEGGIGTDVLVGGDGEDVLIGGQGTDMLTGGLGADVFRWELADRGVKGNPATDTVTDFDPAAAVSGGDILDLRDLLSSESHTAGSTGNLGSYLHFELSGGNTVVHISSTGGFGGGFVSNQEDHSILLQGVDLIGSFSTDQQIIQDLLNKGKLITD